MDTVPSYTQLAQGKNAYAQQASAKEKPAVQRKQTPKSTPTTDTFEQTTPKKQSQPTPTEKPTPLAPWLIAGASLLVSLGTVAVVAIQFFHRPAEVVPQGLTETALKPLTDRLTTLEQALERKVKAGTLPDLTEVQTLVSSFRQEVQTFNITTEGGKTELLQKINDFQKSLETEALSRTLFKTDVENNVNKRLEELKNEISAQLNQLKTQLTPKVANNDRPAVVSRLLKSAKIKPIDYIVPTPVSTKIQLLMDKYKVATGGVYLNGQEFNSASTDLVDQYQPQFETNLSYEDWVNTLKYAKEIHMGDEHGHILKPVLTLFASGAARFKDDAKGEQFEQFTHLMETIMIDPDCGLSHMEQWKELLANLEVDTNAPMVNFGHDALGDRNFNDLYSIPFYSKLIELSKPTAGAEPKFQFHLSNHGLSPLIDFLSDVVKQKKIALNLDDPIRGACLSKIGEEQKMSYVKPYEQLTKEDGDISDVMTHLIKPYLKLMKQASLITFNADSKHLTTHAPLTTESSYIMEAYMGYTPDWNNPQAVADKLNGDFRALIEKLATAVEANDYSTIDKPIYNAVDNYSRLTFTRPNETYTVKLDGKQVSVVGELLTLPNNVTVIHGHDTPDDKAMGALKTTASAAHHINLDNGFLHGFSRNAEKTKTEAQNSGVWDITKTHWLNNTTGDAFMPSITSLFEENLAPLPIAIY